MLLSGKIWNAISRKATAFVQLIRFCVSFTHVIILNFCQYPIRNSTMTNGIVLDPFLGSGSTLIAGSSERLWYLFQFGHHPPQQAVHEDEMGVSDKITSIAIPLGATVNMDAVSIVLSFMIVFFANACGVEVSTSMMIVILLANVILSVGTPGIPGGAIASFAALATMAGLPAGVMGVYISINTLCDMGATCVNVIGDMAGCVVLKEKIKLDD